jgi:hypothetical protein
VPLAWRRVLDANTPFLLRWGHRPLALLDHRRATSWIPTAPQNMLIRACIYELLPAAFDLVPLLVAAKISTSEHCIFILSPTGHEPSRTLEMKPFHS